MTGVDKMGLYEDIKELIQSKFGEFSAAKIDDFKKEINPETNPREFLDKCVDFLSTIFSEERAKEELKGFYEKYT